MDSSNVETPGLTARAGLAKLWDGLDADQLAAAGIDARTRIILEQLHSRHASEIDALLCEIRNGRTRVELMSLYGAVGDAPLIRQMPTFVSEGQWIIQGMLCWADPAGAANVTLVLSIDSIPIPMQLSANKASLTRNVPMSLPVNEHDTLQLSFAGTPGDRAVLLLTFASSV